MKNYLKIFGTIAAAVLLSLLFTTCGNNILNKNITYLVTADHNGNGPTKNLIFIFSESVDEKVYTDHITLTAVDPAEAEITGELFQQNGRYYTLGINVEKEGNIKITISSSGIESGEKTVRVNKTAAPQ